MKKNLLSFVMIAVTFTTFSQKNLWKSTSIKSNTIVFENKKSISTPKLFELNIEELKSTGLYDQIWQAFAVLLPVNTVGVMGDARTYEDVLALRAVTSTDGMTADYYHFTHDFLSRASTRIINEVTGINRVVYDITSKPPGTIEWE